jgi:hypothetical protein
MHGVDYNCPLIPQYLDRSGYRSAFRPLAVLSFILMKRVRSVKHAH